MSYSVYLSPSTQENNEGYGNFGTEEERMNQVCDVVEKILKDHKVIIFRNKPSMSLKQVVADSNTCKPTIHFAIHSNAYNKKSRGCEVFCYKFKSDGHKLAIYVYNQVSTITPSSDRGVKQGFNFYGEGKHMYEVAATTAPAALVEIAFHDNKEDAEWIIKNIELIGTRISIGILNYLGIAYQLPSIKNIEKKTLYRCVAGSFSTQENAEKQAKALRKLGYEIFILPFEAK